MSVCVTISIIPAGGMERGLTVSLEFTSGSLAGEVVYQDMDMQCAIYSHAIYSYSEWSGLPT